MELLESRRLLTSVTASTTSDLIADITAGNSAGAPYTIDLVNTTYDFTTSNNSDSTGSNALPAVTGNITIVGNGAVIQRDSASSTDFRLFEIDGSGALALSNLTLTGGDSTGANSGSGYGGAIYDASTGTLGISNCVISNNAAYGGNNFGSGEAGEGGGIYNADAGAINITQSTLSGDLAQGGGGDQDDSVGFGDGGAIFNQGAGQVTISDSTLSSNSAVGSGGGNLANGGAASGGAIENYGAGSVKITSSTLAANSAAGGSSNYGGGNAVGGGIDNPNTGTVTITSSTLSGNTVGGGRGGFQPNGSSSGADINASGDVILKDTIVADSVSGTLDSSSSYNALVGTSPVAGLSNGTNNNIVVANASALNLGTLSNNGGPTQTIALQNGSVAIGAGTAVSGIISDQRGYGPLPSSPDIGAYQTGASAPETPSLVVTTTADTLFGTGTSLREAVAYAESLGGSQTITFAPALAGDTLDLSTIGDTTFGPTALAITSNITIDGGTSGITLTQDVGNNSPTGGMRLFYVTSAANLTLEHLTLTGGDAVGIGNSGGYGGAIYDASTGTLGISNCVISNNTALGGTNLSSGEPGEGGAIYNSAAGTVDITQSSFMGNLAEASAAETATYGTTPPGAGGAIFNAAGGSIAITASTFSSNTATAIQTFDASRFGNGEGGAIENNGAAAITITTSTFSNNAADSAAAGYGGGTALGGAVDNPNSGTVTITSSTLSGNSVTGLGGAGAQGADVNTSGDVLLKDTIVADSVSGTLDSSSSYNVLVGTSPVAGLSNGTNGNIVVPNASALDLGTLSNNGGPTQTIALLNGSPAIGAGVAVNGITTDQRGVTRAATPSIGAYEYAPPVVTAGATVNYTVGGSAVSTDPGLTVTDLQSTTLASATVTISGGFAAGDVLSVGTAGGLSTSYNAADGILTLSDTASLATYQTALESITFSTSSSLLDSRTISYSASDGTLTSSAATSTVTFTANPSVSVTASSPLALGTTTTGMAGSAASFTVGGGNLTANVLLTAPIGVELSSDGTHYSGTLTEDETAGTLATSTIYARITAGASVGGISGIIAITSTGATEQDVTVSGTVNAAAPSVTTSAATAITDGGATLNGNVTADGGATITGRGFIYGIDPTLTTDTTTDPVTGTTGIFSDTPTGLSAGTMYYFEAYATNSTGTTDGAILPFKTSTPTISVTAASPLALGTTTTGTAGSAASFTVAGGNLTANVLLTAPIGVELSSDGTHYSGTLTEDETAGTLATSTIYARITAGASVGGISGIIAITSTGATEQDVTVSGTVNAAAPSVTTSAATITDGGATLNGNVTSDGGATITGRGFIYGTDPTLTTGTTTDPVTGTTGTFSDTPIGLSSSTTYYFEAYATNSTGTTDGTIQQFKTSAPAPVATAVDDSASIDVGETSIGQSTTVTSSTTATGNVLVNDENLSDDPSTITKVSDSKSPGGVTPGVNGVITIDGTYGTLVLQTTGQHAGNYKYTLDNGAVPPVSATDVFTYTLADGYGNSSTANLTVDLDVTVQHPAPSISTTAMPSSGTVLTTTLKDSATLSGGNNPTGKLTFTLIAPNGATAATETINVSGDKTYTTPTAVLATQVGTYYWVDSYSGDGKNNPVASAAKAEPVVIAKAVTCFSELCDPTILIHSSSQTFSGKISAGCLIPPGNLIVTLNGVQESAAIRSDGTFSVTFSTGKLPVGTYNVQYTYAGNSDFTSANCSSTLKVTYGIKPQYSNSGYKAGSTIPLQFLLTDGLGQDVNTSKTTAAVTGIALASYCGKTLSLPPGNPTTFTANSAGDLFTLNLKTTGLAAGQYILYFTITGDPVVHCLTFTIGK